MEDDTSESHSSSVISLCRKNHTDYKSRTPFFTLRSSPNVLICFAGVSDSLTEIYSKVKLSNLVIQKMKRLKSQTSSSSIKRQSSRMTDTIMLVEDPVKRMIRAASSF